MTESITARATQVTNGNSKIGMTTQCDHRASSVAGAGRPRIPVRRVAWAQSGSTSGQAWNLDGLQRSEPHATVMLSGFFFRP